MEDDDTRHEALRVPQLHGKALSLYLVPDLEEVHGFGGEVVAD